MSFVIHPPEITAYQLPDDGPEARAAFLRYFSDPSETWLRAFGFTMADLVEEIIAAHKAGTPLHVFLDRSQENGHAEKPLAERLVAAGVEVTVGTSYAGRKYIMHQKGYTTSGNDCWEGSVNFSTSGWEQVNSALQFNSPEWKDVFVKSFEHNVQYAWATERQYQLMPEPPAWL